VLPLVALVRVLRAAHVHLSPSCPGQSGMGALSFVGLWLESPDCWRPVWYRLTRPRVDASTPFQLPPADACRALLASLHFTAHEQSASYWEALLPHFSAPALHIAPRVSSGECTLLFCALALAYARSDASTLFPVGKHSENLPRPTLQEELFDFLRAASACSASLACCLALRLACPGANRLSESCPCLAHLAWSCAAAWSAHLLALL
jgi:hypothetical protein